MKTLPLTAFFVAVGTAGAQTGDLDSAIKAALPRTVKLLGASVGNQPGYGAGVIVSADGKVVTTLSFLLEAEQVRAVTADGRLCNADILARDAKRQLALLQLKPVDDANANLVLPYFEHRSSAHLQPGDWVLSVANPFKVADGAEPASIAVGVFSTRARLQGRQRLEPYPYDGDVLVIDAITATPGSAGGALVDLDGNWVGLIGEIVVSRLTNTRLNYAVPIEEVAAFLEAAKGGRLAAQKTENLRPENFTPGYHGIKLFEKSYRRDHVFVEKVARGSPADAANMKTDDRIVSVNGILVRGARDFQRAAGRLRPGEQLVLVVERDRKLMTLHILLTERSNP